MERSPPGVMQADLRTSSPEAQGLQPWVAHDSTELFAEAFWRFYTDNETLAANCPKLYSLMSRVCPAPDN